MTANQIAYQNMLEARRSNQARELENSRHNLATEAHNTSALAETIRSNKANEALGRESNVIKWNTLQETQRSNLANELLISQRNAETARHNVAVESEAERANKAAESTKTFAAMTQAANFKQQLAETKRHNQETEKIQTVQAVTGGVQNITKGVQNITDSLGLSSLAKSILSLR